MDVKPSPEASVSTSEKCVFKLTLIPSAKAFRLKTCPYQVGHLYFQMGLINKVEDCKEDFSRGASQTSCRSRSMGSEISMTQ
jgi:hypothetical protein